MSRHPPPPALPPLVLRCRPIWRLAYGGSALLLLALGASTLAGAENPGGSTGAEIAAAAVLLAFGAGCAQFFLRYCLAHLSLDDHGFRLAGPLIAARQVGWEEVDAFSRVRAAGPGALRIVYGETRRRLTLPLIYEDSHALEVGLAQRRFPIY